MASMQLDNSLYDTSVPASPETLVHDLSSLSKLAVPATIPTASSNELLSPGSLPYERAISTGNLLYRLMTPAAVAQPRTAEEVSQIVKFARDNGFQLTVKNGGHGFAGYCLNKGGIVLDMSAMKHIEVNEASTEITIQGGCVWKDVYAKLGGDKANIVAGCQNPTVGVSGFILGGGISPFSRSYGLGVDNITEMTIVTASGDIVTVTDHETDSHKQNLFWALRGAGGGNFGVLVEFKSKVHKLRDASGTVACGRLSWDLTKSDAAFKAMMETFNAMDCPSELTVDATWRENVGELTVFYNGAEEECRKAIAPLLRFSPSSDTVKATHWSEWVHEEEGFDHTSAIYHHHASFVLPQGALNTELTEQVAKLMQESHERFTLTSKGESTLSFNHIGAETASSSAAASSFPWRTGAYVARLKVQWNEQAASKEMMSFVQKYKTALKPFAIQESAAYVNYIDSTVENWQSAYYGENYARLQQVKSAWDPTDFFHFDRSIELPHWSRTPVAQTAVKRTEVLWNECSWSNSSVLRNLADEDMVYGVVGAERMKRVAA